MTPRSFLLSTAPMTIDRLPSAATRAADAGGVPLEAVQELQRERDHLLLLHEALVDVERATTIEARLDVLVDAIRRIGFGRVALTLRDADLNAIGLVSAGLSDEEVRVLRDKPSPGHVWRERLAAIERFRISDSYYLDGRDPWVASAFAGGVESRMSAAANSDWSPTDMLLVPLRGTGGNIVATLLLDDPSDRARPTLTRVRTVELFGRQVAAMLERAALVELAEGRAARLQKLHEIGTLLARSLDEDAILRALAREVEGLLPASSVVVFATDDAGVSWPRVYRLDGHETSAGTAPLPLCALAGKAADARRAITEAHRAAVPAVLAGSVLGVIAIESRGSDPLLVRADDVDLLLTIGGQAASALSNARMYAESQRQRRQTEALAEVSRAVGESLRLERVMRLILRHAVALLRTDGASISLMRGDVLEIVAGIGSGESLVGIRLPLVGSMSGRVVRTGQRIIGDVSADEEAYPQSVRMAGIRNVIIVPLSSMDRMVGVLSVFNRAEPFAEADAEVLNRLADQVAVAVVNARLFEEAAEATREWAVAFDAIGSGMVLLDAQGRIQRTNARARQLMGAVEEETLRGATLHSALFGDESPCDACVHMAAIRDGQVRRGTHGHLARGRVYDLTAAPHPHGGAVVTFDDVTEHRALAERHRRVVETSRDAIVITDRERRIAFANPAAIAFFGYGEALVGMPVSRTVPPEMREHVRRHEDDALAGTPQRYEGMILRADGERRIVEVTTAPLIELGEVTGIVASLRDITDERRARDAVAQSEARYRNLFDSASDALYTLDVKGIFTSVNEATMRMCGLPRTDLLGHSSRMLFDDSDGADLALVTEQFGRAVRGDPVRYECHFRRGDGERRLVSVTNTPIRLGRKVVGVLGVARDVTDERARAAALQRSEARYTRLVESASDAIFTVSEDGSFTAVNRSLEHAVGRSRQQLVGAAFTCVLDTRDVDEAERLLRATFTGERCRGSVRYRAADGSVRHGSVITAPVFEDETIVGALGIMRDVTDEQRLAGQLLQQEKLAAVGQLVSGVAHELNNPLAGVMAFSELLLSSPASQDEEARRALETIHHEAMRAAKIVSHLLTFARQRPAERMEADLNQIVTDTLTLRRYALSASQIELDVVLDPTLPRTWADPFQLQQVVLNLLGNAEQALADWQGDRRIVVWTRHDDECLVIAVSDSGPGIPAEQRDRIFNPFYTTKPVGQGTGLGLSISDGIVREHGGQIRVESHPGDGATFLIQLPVVTPLTGLAGQQKVAAKAASAPRRVLVVDDEPSMRAAIATFLTSLGHTVTVVSRGEEARALLAANEYDVVLLDLRMSGVGGDTLYHELCESDPRHASRVVFVTGDLENEHSKRFLDQAGRPSVSKPFQLDDLAAVLAVVPS
jgi:PAS domain S-box-containing protein